MTDTITKESDGIKIQIVLYEEGLVWTDIHNRMIDCLKGLGFNSEEFDEMYHW